MTPFDIAFLFPGQGSQTVGMGVGLAASYQSAKNVFDEVRDRNYMRVGEKFFPTRIYTY